MTSNTAHKFINPNGTFNTVAAINAGHDARTNGLREFGEIFAKCLKAIANLNVRTPFLPGWKT